MNGKFELQYLLYVEDDGKKLPLDCDLCVEQIGSKWQWEIMQRRSGGIVDIDGSLHDTFMEAVLEGNAAIIGLADA
jgi:hypothetical protein